MDERRKDLPEECWELIFNRLDHHRHLESISLVCKQFLSILNRLRHNFTVSDPTTLLLPQLFQRFPHLKNIDIRDFHGDADRVVIEIARSGLDLEALSLVNLQNIPLKGLRELGLNMKSLKVLNCPNLLDLRDKDAVAIASSLPRLEQLDISYPKNDYHDLSGAFVSDAGIEVLACNLKALCKIDISGNHFISDKSLLVLSSNCVFLKDIAVKDCCLVTQNGIGFVMRHSPNLMSLSTDVIETSSLPPSGMLTIQNSIVYARALCGLELSDISISDSLLCSIAESHLELKKLTLRYCRTFTNYGLSLLLHSCQSLNHLNLEGIDFLTDQYMCDLSQYLRYITCLNLNGCCSLTNSTFFMLAKNCPLLVEIEMEGTSLGEEENFGMDLAKNHHIQSLKLACNMLLNDGSLKKFGLMCPNLRLLDVSHCWKITNQCIGEVLKSCNEIRYLAVSRCRDKNILGTESEVCALSLEVLQATGSRINDEGMAMIGRRCHGLLHLVLECCSKVTEKGVKEVVANCKQLREINLKGCCNVSVDILAWMVFSRPSLRKIIPPHGFVPTESQKKLFLRHGCLVCDG